MAVDGTVLDVPDSKANARVFGYPSSRLGMAITSLVFSNFRRPARYKTIC